jgi:hypothetical protein
MIWPMREDLKDYAFGDITFLKPWPTGGAPTIHTTRSMVHSSTQTHYYEYYLGRELGNQPVMAFARPSAGWEVRFQVETTDTRERAKKLGIELPRLGEQDLDNKFDAFRSEYGLEYWLPWGITDAGSLRMTWTAELVEMLATFVLIYKSYYGTNEGKIGPFPDLFDFSPKGVPAEFHRYFNRFLERKPT